MTISHPCIRLSFARRINKFPGFVIPQGTHSIEAFVGLPAWRFGPGDSLLGTSGRGFLNRRISNEEH